LIRLRVGVTAASADDRESVEGIDRHHQLTDVQIKRFMHAHLAQASALRRFALHGDFSR
jgi:hypothetical protein